MNLIKYLTPINLADEKAKFFSSSTYNPQLKYFWEETEAIKWIGNHPELQEFINALNSQDHLQVKYIASNLFDTQLTQELLASAKQIVSIKPEVIPTEPIAKVTEAFNQAFSFLGLNEYSVKVVDEHGFNFRPSTKDKKITVSKHLNLDFFSIDGEVKHELVHIIRYENGQHNCIPTSHDYLPTDEGLATYCQDYAGENGQASLFQHAAEYSMTEVALNGSLRDVTNYLENIGFSKELSWQRAIRHKFGFMDTSKPGDIMKPSMYFYHQQFIKKLSADEKYRLFVGKIILNQLNGFPEYIGVISLKKLKKFYIWNDLI